MKLFKKEMYTIVADKVTNLEVLRFAEECNVKHSIIDVRSCGELVTISFGSRKKRGSILDKLKSRFEDDFNVRMGEHFIFVTKK